MRKRMQVLLSFVMTVLCSILMLLPAYAVQHPAVSVPVSISLSGKVPSPAENYTVVLKAGKADNPMPDGSAEGMYTLTMTGEGTKNLPTITYDKVGVYTYTIYQEAGTNPKCTYDDEVYVLTVTVSNGKEPGSLEVTAVLNTDSDEGKLPDVEFENEYTEEDPIPDAPKTGDEATPMLYVVMIVASLGVIAALFLTREKKRREE